MMQGLWVLLKDITKELGAVSTRAEYDEVGLQITVDWDDGYTVSRVFTSMELRKITDSSIIYDMLIEWMKYGRERYLCRPINTGSGE